VRILYLTINPNRASTTVPTEGWFTYLRPLGLEPVLVSHRTGTLHAWAVRQGIPAYQVRLESPAKLWPWRFFRSVWRLIAIVRRHRIQAIHCNEHNTYPIAGCVARLCGLPAIVSVQFTIDRAFGTWAFRGSRRPDRLVFTSRGSRDACRPGVDGIVPEVDWRLLYNGVNVTALRPDPAGRAAFRRRHRLGDGPAIGNACYIQPRKQLEHLFTAAARLAVPGLRVLLAGGPVAGAAAYAARLIRQAREQLGDRFVYLGHQDELRGFYNALDLLVNTCPVISYTSTSAGEQVPPGGGEIVAQDQVAELTAALRRWLADRPRLAAARRPARRRAAEAFDIRHLSAQLWDEYQAVVQAASAANGQPSRTRRAGAP
jgi:glycosyltransferase involved in cell wall biosynthesis